MKLPEFEVGEPTKAAGGGAEMPTKVRIMPPSVAIANASTNALEAHARMVINELRERGRPLGIEGDGAHHHDALRSLECLATSARTVESIASAKLANDGT